MLGPVKLDPGNLVSLFGLVLNTNQRKTTNTDNRIIAAVPVLMFLLKGNIVMCFSLESSLSAWALSIAFVVLLWTRDRLYDRWNASFLLCFSTIQLVEAGLWYNMGSSPSNGTLTKTILPLLLLQPLVQNYAGWKATGSPILKNTTLLYLVLFLSGLSYISGKDTKTVIGEKGHLVWETNEEEGLMPSWMAPLYLFGLFFPLLWQKEKGVPLLATGVATALYSWFQTKGREFSSYWCFTSVIYGVVAYVA